MSASDGALDAVAPVAAHIPGGGLASINFKLAVRTRFEIAEALVDVRWRRVLPGESGGVALESGSRMPFGCGKGTGVGVEFEDAIARVFASGCTGGHTSFSDWWPISQLACLAKLNDQLDDRWHSWQWHKCLGRNLAIGRYNLSTGWQRHNV